MSVNITKKTGTANTTALAGRAISYIAIHYTAGVSSASGTAANVAAYFAKADTKASADFIVDDANIVQYNPDPANRYCWAVGGSKLSTKGGSLYGTAKNANSISVEICSTNSTSKVADANASSWSFTTAVIAKAVELVKYLMELYGIDSSHVIRHYDVTGKLCPGIVGWNADSGSETAWNSFKAQLGSVGTATTETASSGDYYRVRKTWADESSQKGAFTSLANAKKCADLYSGYYVFDWNGNAVYPESSSSSSSSGSSVPYKVKIEISDLNIRKGPGTSYAKTGKFTGKGTFTIVEEDSGWGLLKAYESSRDGWISLSYATKVS